MSYNGGDHKSYSLFKFPQGEIGESFEWTWCGGHCGQHIYIWTGLHPLQNHWHLKNSKNFITINTSTKVHLVQPIHLFIIIRKVEKVKCSFQPKDLSEPPIEPRNPTKFPLNQKTHHLNNEAMSFKSLE